MKLFLSVIFLAFVLNGNVSGYVYSCSGQSKSFRFAVRHAAKSDGSTSTIYYVSPTGNDKDNGMSANRAWKTIAKVNLTKFKPGDAILFYGGGIFAGNIVVANSGADGNYIRYGSYGPGRATIIAGSGTGIYIHNQSDIWVDNLIIKGSFNEKTQSGNTGAGAEFANDLSGSVTLGACYVSNCDISGFFKAGIQFRADPKDNGNSGFSNVFIYANTIHNNSIAGVTSFVYHQAKSGSSFYAFGNVYVAYNKVYDNLGYKPGTGSHTGDGIVIGSAGGGIIEHNLAWGNGWNNTNIKGGPAAIWCWDSTGVLFQYNEAYHNGSTSKVDGDGFDLDGGSTYCIMQYNYSHDNAGAGFLMWEYGNPRGNVSHNIIRHNISKSDGKENGYSSIYIGANSGTCNNNDVYNNTCYNFGPCVKVVEGNIENRFLNNILYTTERDSAIVVVKKGGWFLNNDYYQPSGTFKVSFNEKTYASLSDLQSSGISESQNGSKYGYNVDPLLKDPVRAGKVDTFFPNTLRNFDLNVSSPMRNAGYDLKLFGLSDGGNDFNGLSAHKAQAPDIGACGYQ